MNTKRRFYQAAYISLFTLLFTYCSNTDTATVSESINNDSNAVTSAPLYDAEIEHRVDSVLALMNLREKIGQLNQVNGFDELTGPGAKSEGVQDILDKIARGDVGSMLNVTSVDATRRIQELVMEKSRLKIPLIFAYDVIHGYQTMFPVPLGESASWDMDAIQASAQIAAKEATSAGIHWTYAPMVDIARDARWGRVMEGAGEDPYLGAKVAVARVKGFQGDDLASSYTLAACAKHLAGYGYAEGGRDYNTVEISDHTLHNVVLPPFKASVEAGVASLMNAFNDHDGVPATGNKYLQRDILKGDWGFNGLVVSDWASIKEMIDHGAATDLKEAAFRAITAGNDVDMCGYAYELHLEELINAGEVDESILDEAVKRVLRIKFLTGIMDDPFKYFNEEREKNTLLAEEHLSVARDVARKSIVLLKNENQLLPLTANNQTIAVIGPFAADKDVPLGSWRAQAISNSAVSLLDGIKNEVGDQAEVLYAEGCKHSIGLNSFVQELTINTTDYTGIDDAVKLAGLSDVVILTLGEHNYQSGEARSKTSIELSPVQQELLKRVLEANKKVIVVLMNGRPLDISWMAENAPTILETWHLGSESGNAIADVLFGKYNPSGKLPVSFPRNVGQVPIYYSRKNTGRGIDDEGNVFWSHYIDEENDALYPFGYGLSYTNFDYESIQLSNTELTQGGSITASITISNTGDRAGTEVVQLYIQDMVGSLTRPMKELKGFQRVGLNSGESKEVTFEISTKDLEFYNIDKEWVAEPGDFKLYIGPNSRDVQEVSFSLK
ncbi:MAG: beta-glucosidase BglX [Bacteroidota bacterium]